MTLNQEITQEYFKYHIPKEETFWKAYMGLSSYEEGSLEAKEKAYLDFLNNPQWGERISRELESSSLNDKDRGALLGWQRFFGVSKIDSPKASILKEELLALEEKLAKSRRNFRYTLEWEENETEQMGINRLSLLCAGHESEVIRKRAWEGLKSLDSLLLENQFLEVVKKRNKMARFLGFEDYYDYKSRIYENLSKKEIFQYLDPLMEEAKTALQKNGKWEKPWNTAFKYKGKSTPIMDEYFPLSRAVAVWGESFENMGYQFNGARITLDLLARDGKYSNGFMHAPFPPYREGDTYFTGIINFSSNAVPGAPGAGARALGTLMHEGGHAAHFANVDQDAPVFSQEFPPTSAALAESQSMFADSFMQDPAWILYYGKDADGKAIPREKARDLFYFEQQGLPFRVMSLLAVSYIEKVLYEMKEEDLEPRKVISRVEEVEKSLWGGELGYRPGLSVPHLISSDASANYHGYVLALMGVYQMRKYLYENLPWVVNNPKVGQILREKIWNWGNRKTYSELLEGLTGYPIDSQALIEVMKEDWETQWNSITARLLSPVSMQSHGLKGELILTHGDREMVRSSNGGWRELDRVWQDFLQKYY